MTDNGMILRSGKPAPGTMCAYRGCRNVADEAHVFGDSRWARATYSCSDHVGELLNQLMRSKDKTDSLSAAAVNLKEGRDFIPWGVPGSEVMVLHGRLVDDDDPRWLLVREHIRRHGMELVDRCEGEHPKFNMGAVAWWYATPERRKLVTPDEIETFRRGLFGTPDGE